MSIIGGMAAGMGIAAAAHAQLTADFEPPPYSGSSAGVILPGQAGWYLAGQAIEGRVYRYEGNTLGIVTNPTGGSQFAGLRGHSGMTARAQHDADFSARGVWTAAFDICVDRFGGVLPATDNIGSFSLQPSAASRYWQTLVRWDDTLTGNAADFAYVFYNAAGVFQPVTVPGPAWDARSLNTWYRQSTTWDFDTNRILSVSIDNLHDPTPPTTVDVSGLGWYLAGGASTTLPLPTSVRLFSSGAAANWNIAAWDNLVVIPAPGVPALLLAATGIRARRRPWPPERHRRNCVSGLL